MRSLETKSALTSRVQRVEGAPVVTVRVVAAGGARGETIPGQALVTGRMLSEGTRHRDWRKVAEDAEALGMAISSSGSFEGHGISVDALAEDWSRALDWAAELALEPSFPEDRLGWVVRQSAAELESLADQPEVRCSWAFKEQLYEPHPLARRLQGDPEALGKLTARDCRQFHERSLRHGTAVIVAGRIPEEEVRRAVEQVFSSLAVPADPRPEPALPHGLGDSRREVQLPPGDQAHLLLGHLTVPRRHPDGPALQVLGVILGAGSGLGGRIPARIREREGLAYVAQAHTVSGAGLDPGKFVVYVGTSPATVTQAESSAREEIQRVLDEGVSEEEVEEARSYLLGREPFRRETARQWSDLLIEAQWYGLPLEDRKWCEDRLREVDTQAVEDAARRHLRPDELKATVGLPDPEVAPRGAAAAGDSYSE